ncbi:hypothetical protein FRC03_010349 [Tulasnella sp. 419]|nr:hypothetical protein FRC03_010349 [Tulasnella sp. 419]
MESESAPRSSLLALPNELLEEIILYVVESQFPYGRYLKDLNRISLICSRMYDIIENTPRFWSSIASQSILQTSTQLKKSADCPLRIYISGDLNTVSLLSSHIHRWQHVHFRYLNIDDWNLLFRKPAPLLESFRVECWLPGLALELFQGHAPKLRHLDIANHCMSWDLGLMKGLTYLRLRAWDSRTKAMPTSGQYLEMLMNCPNLEEFHLTGRGYVSKTPNLSNTLQADVHLPRLIILALTGELQGAIVQSFLRHIKAPRLIDVRVPRWNSSFNALHSLNGAPIQSPIKEVLLNPGRVAVIHGVWCSPVRLEITGSKELNISPKLTITIPGSSTELIKDILPQPSYTHITTLEFCAKDHSRRRWFLSHFRLLQNLVHLKLEGDGGRLENVEDREFILGVLLGLRMPYCEELSSVPHRCPLACPRLKDLWLMDTQVTCEDLVPFVQTRSDEYQANSSQTSSNEEVLPARLQELTITTETMRGQNICTSSAFSYDAPSMIVQRMGQGFIWDGHHFDPSRGWQNLWGCEHCLQKTLQ